jgi:hypothetical protein
MPRKRRKKSWRHFIVNGMPPPRYELIDRYSNLIETVTDIVTNEAQGPKSLSHWFYKSLSWKLFGQTKVCTPHTYILIRVLINELPELSREDIEQQAWLYLMEMWNFYVDNYRHNKAVRFVFYDYIRFNLVKYMSNWIANQIKISTADSKANFVSDVTYIEEPKDINVDLGWVILQSDTGFLSELSVRQKYLIFLRYVKELSIMEISDLMQRNHKSIEKDFTAINKLLNGDSNEQCNKSNSTHE